MVALLLSAALSDSARAQEPVAAVFPFELYDTSLQGEVRGYDPGDLTRLHQLDSQLFRALTQSGRFRPVVVATDPAGPNLRTCDGCEIDRARSARAQVAVVGWVQKVSNLILNINIVMRNVGTGQRVVAGSVDIRGDTDESWARGLSYLLRNRMPISDVPP